jgi:hypothetical protein
MFAKQQAASDLNKAREEYNAQSQKGIQIGLEEAAQAEPVRRSEKDTHVIEGTSPETAECMLSARTRCIQLLQNAVWTQTSKAFDSRRCL